MLRKAKGSRRINHQGAERKQKIGRRLRTRGIFGQFEKLLSLKYREKLRTMMSQSCFHWAGYLACKFCLAPLTMNADREFGMERKMLRVILHHCFLGLMHEASPCLGRHSELLANYNFYSNRFSYHIGSFCTCAYVISFYSDSRLLILTTTI